MYIDKLDDIVNKYNNTYHSTIRMKPIDINPSTHIGFGRKNNDKDPKFKVGEHVRISKFINVKNAVPRTYTISDLNGEEIVGMLYEKELQKAIQTEFRIEKVIKKSCDNSFNSWINKKDIVI